MAHAIKRRDLLALPLALSVPGSPTAAILMRFEDGSVLHAEGPADTWLLAPGSTIKPFTLQALLDAHRLSASDHFLCPGVLHVAGRNLTCSHPRGLPPLNVTNAIAYSCNCAVAHFAQRFSTAELQSALRTAGFRTAPANLTLQALGEEGVLTTPRELAQAYRRLARLAHPAILAGLEGAVQYGTAQSAALPGFTVAGKTGTSRYTALFAGFAPSRVPTWVVTVATQGHSGGADAAPIARELLRKAAGPSYRVRIRGTIVEIPVERYVAAVLAGEASTLHQPEALKAMAVAARSYAAHERGRHSPEGFDFCNTTHCQRAELSGITPAMETAVQTTVGRLLRFHGELAFAPYTMSCGGVAEDGRALWPDLRAPYLRSHPDPFCDKIEWQHRIALSDVERALHASALACPMNLARVAIVERTPAGRARRLALEGRERVLIDAGSFRFAIGRTLGWNLIRSNWFELANEGGQLAIHGKGEGHGIGLCQNGAEHMAAAGHSYREILAFYYPGATALEWIRLGGEDITLYTTDPAHDAALLRTAERLNRTLPWPARGAEIYAYPTLEDFRSSTAEPGWVAAHTVGRHIDLQPARLLAERGILDDTLHHELLHVAVEARAHPSLPLWFREGVVEWLSGSYPQGTAAAPADSDLRQRTDRSRAEQAHQQARALVSQLVDRYGETAVLGWISRGLPAEVKNSTASSATTKIR
ncbi:MAG TPA: SpoIID/LytB domain-containing protein [Bryobacteraceae bacterium]|jgi:stage II sporulation protein D|nr:SpoIID/LytB domain-containing protein [Bryobacteraceae bacterium]